LEERSVRELSSNRDMKGGRCRGILLQLSISVIYIKIYSISSAPVSEKILTEGPCKRERAVRPLDLLLARRQR